MSQANGPSPSSPAIGEAVTVTVERLGGIDETTVTIPAGVTILSGENATNRTSFLRSLAAALGGRDSAVSIKSDATAGRVELSTAEGTYARVYTERGFDATESSPMTDDASLVDTFVAVDERNPARRAIRGGGEGLRELLMAPVDTDSIQAEIRERKAERRELETELDRIESRQAKLPELERRRDEVYAELGEVTAELETLQEAIEEAALDESAAEAVEELYAEQSAIRESIGEKERVLERQREKVAELESERESLEADLADIAVEAEELADINDQLEQLRRRKRELEGFTNDIAAVLEVNQDLLEDEYAEMTVETDVTASLDPASTEIRCWTCGSEVQRTQVTDRLDSLRELLRSKQAERDDVVDRIADLEERAREIEQEKRRKSQLEADLRDTEEELELRTERVADLETEIAALHEDLAELESEVAAAETGPESDLAEQYQRLSDLEYERGRLAEERSTVVAEIEEIEGLVEDRRPAVEDQLETVRDEVESLRDRVASIEESVIETFDEHMNELLDRLHYQNIERVWLERRVGPDAEPGAASEFVLHVVREGPDGAVYEDTVETLSESERELIGIVIALAGYFVHDVAEAVPFVLLDSVESIDAERLSTILAYIGEHVPYLLTAVLPEEAAALPSRYTRITADELA